MPIVQRPRPQAIGEQWEFVGSAVYAVSHQHANLMTETFACFLEGDWIRAWFNEYYETRAHVNTGMVRQLMSRADELLTQWTSLRDAMITAMMPVYCRQVIDEWVGSHIDVHVRQIERVRERLAKALQ